MPNLKQLAMTMELRPRDLAFLQAPNLEAALAGLKAFKRKVKRHRKLLSKRYHPDLPNGDLEKMQLVNQAADMLLQLEILIHHPMPVFVHVYTAYQHYGPGTWHNTTDTTTGGFY